MLQNFISRRKSAITLYLMAILTIFVLLPPSMMAGSDSHKILSLPDQGVEIRLIGDSAYQVSLDGFTQTLPQKPMIRLNHTTFDPLTDTNRTFISPSLTAEVSDVTDTLYIVQFFSQAFESVQNHLTALGAVVVEPIPDHALIVKMSGALSKEIAQLSFVRWVGPYHPAYKLGAEIAGMDRLQADNPACYSLWLSEAGNKTDLSDFLEDLSGNLPEVGESRRVEITLTGAELSRAAQRTEILSIDPCTQAEDDLDGVRESSGVNYIETVEGYKGEGVGAEVLDGGFRISHLSFKDNPLMVHSPSHYPGDMGHGTPCAGILFSTGAANKKATGLMPNAARPIVASRKSLWGSGGKPTLAKRKAHTRELIDPSGPYRAVLQTSSWGNSRTRRYTSISAEMDEIIFDLDILLLQSQSNAGNQDSRPEAWAKNIVSVGGIKSGNTLKRSDDRWGGTLGGISSSASIGPASDGRIKPDLSHFYGLIYSPSDTSNTAHREFGGTSGATPATAGLFGLMYQMWADGILNGGPGQNRDVFNARPHASTAKALMIHSAYRYSFSGKKHDRTRVHQGWGMADVKILYDMAKDHNWRFPVLIDESKVISATEVHSYGVKSNGNKPLLATMVYTDPPANPSASVHRVNDLTLKVISPDGTIYWGNNGLLEGNWSTPGGSANTIDTVENVFIKQPAAGTWTVQLIASEVVKDNHTETPAIDADYALVVSGGTAGNTPPNDQFTLSTSVEGKGSVTADPKGGPYQKGTVVTLTATPAPDYEFAGWRQDLSGTTNPATLTMNSNKTVTAVFRNTNQVSTIAFDGMGSSKFSGGRGWKGPWTKSGSMVLLKKNPYGGKRYLKIRGGKTPGRIERVVDLSNVTGAKLRFANRIKSFESTDKAFVKVSSDGVNYTTVAEFSASQSDNVWRLEEIDLSGMQMSAGFKVVFESAMSSKLKDMWFIDNIEVLGNR